MSITEAWLKIFMHFFFGKKLFLTHMSLGSVILYFEQEVVILCINRLKGVQKFQGKKMWCNTSYSRQQNYTYLR